MIGKFVGTTTELQAQCRGPNGYDFSEESHIQQLFDVPLMDYDVSSTPLRGSVSGARVTYPDL